MELDAKMGQICSVGGTVLLLEDSDAWYFVGLPDIDVVGCFAELP